MSSNNNSTFLEAVVALLLLFPVTVFLPPWVALKLYEWHLMPVWEGAPVVSYQHMLGVMMFVHLFRPHQESKKLTSAEEDGILALSLKSSLEKGLTLGFMLLLGWIAA